MKYTKFVVVSAIGGFVLSFFFGLFSHSKFVRIFLLALLFALVFAALGFVIGFLYTKFLDVDGGEGFISSSSGSDGKAMGAAGGGKSGNHSKVDIVIAESDLEQTGNSNHYDVGDHKQMLNDSDVKASPAESYFADSGFVPLRSKETVNNFSGTEADSESSFTAVSLGAVTGGTKKSSAPSSSNSSISSISSFSSMDELPDMGDLNVSATRSAEESEILSDNSDFISSALKYKDDNDGNIKDASLMARAISSILSEET